MVFELLLIAGGLITATALWTGWWRSRQAVRTLTAVLRAAPAESDPAGLGGGGRRVPRG